MMACWSVQQGTKVIKALFENGGIWVAVVFPSNFTVVNNQTIENTLRTLTNIFNINANHEMPISLSAVLDPIGKLQPGNPAINANCPAVTVKWHCQNGEAAQ